MDNQFDCPIRTLAVIPRIVWPIVYIFQGAWLLCVFYAVFRKTTTVLTKSVSDNVMSCHIVTILTKSVSEKVMSYHVISVLTQSVSNNVMSIHYRSNQVGQSQMRKTTQAIHGRSQGVTSVRKLIQRAPKEPACIVIFKVRNKKEDIVYMGHGDGPDLLADLNL